MKRGDLVSFKMDDIHPPTKEWWEGARYVHSDEVGIIVKINYDMFSFDHGLAFVFHTKMGMLAIWTEHLNRV